MVNLKKRLWFETFFSLTEDAVGNITPSKYSTVSISHGMRFCKTTCSMYSIKKKQQLAKLYVLSSRLCQLSQLSIQDSVEGAMKKKPHTQPCLFTVFFFNIQENILDKWHTSEHLFWPSLFVNFFPFLFFQDMLCFSGGGMLNIKASNFPVHQQKLQVCEIFQKTFLFIALFLQSTCISVFVSQVCDCNLKFSKNCSVLFFHWNHSCVNFYSPARVLLLVLLDLRSSVFTCTPCLQLKCHR